MDTGRGAGRHRGYGTDLWHVVGVLPGTFRRDPPTTPKSSVSLGLRPDIDCDLDCRNRHRAACRGVLHRAES